MFHSVSLSYKSFNKSLRIKYTELQSITKLFTSAQKKATSNEMAYYFIKN